MLVLRDTQLFLGIAAKIKPIKQFTEPRLSFVTLAASLA